MRKLVSVLSGILMEFSTPAVGEVVKEWSVHYELEDFEFSEYYGRIYVSPRFTEETFDLAMSNFFVYDKAALPRLIYSASDNAVGAKVIRTDVEVSQRILVMENVEIGTQGNFCELDPSDGLPPKLQKDYPDVKANVEVNVNLLTVEIDPFEYDCASK